MSEPSERVSEKPTEPGWYECSRIQWGKSRCVLYWDGSHLMHTTSGNGKYHRHDMFTDFRRLVYEDEQPSDPKGPCTNCGGDHWRPDCLEIAKEIERRLQQAEASLNILRMGIDDAVGGGSETDNQNESPTHTHATSTLEVAKMAAERIVRSREPDGNRERTRRYSKIIAAALEEHAKGMRQELADARSFYSRLCDKLSTLLPGMTLYNGDLLHSVSCAIETLKKTREKAKADLETCRHSRAIVESYATQLRNELTAAQAEVERLRGVIVYCGKAFASGVIHCSDQNVPSEYKAKALLKEAALAPSEPASDEAARAAKEVRDE